MFHGTERIIGLCCKGSHLAKQAKGTQGTYGQEKGQGNEGWWAAGVTEVSKGDGTAGFPECDYCSGLCGIVDSFLWEFGMPLVLCGSLCWGGRIYYLRRASDFFRGLNAFFFPLCLHIIKLIIA